MNSPALLMFRSWRWFGIMAGLLLLAGCATAPKIDWASRAGIYTFDQAVTDYGPPDKQATLQDGTVVADWITSRGYTHAYLTPGSYYGRYGGFYDRPVYNETRMPDYLLRLTFRPDGKLSAWKNLMR